MKDNLNRGNSIEKSLSFLQLEKLLIITKEVDFIKNILDYFCGYDCRDEDKNKKFLQENIKKLKHDINNIFKRIENLKDINTNIINKSSDIEFIIFYDYVRTQIEELLSIIEALYTKMNQLFGEMLNQYIPYPTFFGRRYSSYGILMYLDHAYESILKKLIEPKTPENNIVLGWSYNTGFKHKILRNKDIQRVNYNYETHNDYIELPYWYYELPFLIPAITHEVVSIALRKKGSRLEDKYYKKFHNKLKTFFDDNSNRLVREIGDVLGYEWLTKELSQDIYADIIAYEIHGYSYVLTLVHNLLGEKISKDFIEVVYEDDGNRIEKYNFKPNDWLFSPKREHNHLRIYFMLSLLAMDKKQCNKEIKREEIIAFIKNTLDLIIELISNTTFKKTFNCKASLENKKNGFEKLYRENFPNYYSTYEVVKIYLKQLTDFLLSIDRKIIIPKNLKKILKQINFIDFNPLWEERFLVINNNENKVPYKGKFRQFIHREISDIEYLKNNDENGIWVLTLRKVRKDYINKKFTSETSLDDFKKKMKEIMDDTHSLINQKFIAYGIYDYAYLEKKENTLNVKELLEEILNKKRENELFYFDSKSILMKISETVYGKRDTEKKAFSLIINIELIKDSKKPNGYKDLKKAVESLSKTLKDKQEMFEKADIYKSLGPKDLTVIIQNSNINNLYEIINYIYKEDAKEKLINRTFSIFCSKHYEDNQNLQIEENYSFVTYIRVARNNKGEELIKKIRNEDKTAEIFQTSGVMDFRIKWSEKSISKLFEKYEKLYSYITDYQTKIEKIM